MKKMIFSLIIILCLPGCWNYKELNEYSIVTGMAIDKIEDGYKVSTLISNVQKSNNGSDSNSSHSDIVIYEGNGKSIYEAFKDIGLVSPKELYLNSFSILIISEEAARSGINSILNFFLRYTSSRNNFDIVISKDCDAKDTLKILTPITNSPSQSISDNLKTTTQLQGSIKTISFDDLVSTIIKEGVEPTISSISIVGDIKTGSSDENLKSSEPETYIKLNTLSIFKGDKLIDFATHDESVGINIIGNHSKEIYFNLDYSDGFVTIDTTSFKSKINSEIKNNTPIININLSGEARIIEVSGNINLENDSIIRNIEKMANQKLEEFVDKAIQLSLKSTSDILGIGREFYKNHNSFYTKNKYLFTDNLDEIIFNIDSNIIINNTVSVKNSVEVKNVG